MREMTIDILVDNKTIYSTLVIPLGKDASTRHAICMIDDLISTEGATRMSALDEASQFLRVFLKNGPQPSTTSSQYETIILTYLSNRFVAQIQLQSILSQVLDFPRYLLPMTGCRLLFN